MTRGAANSSIPIHRIESVRRKDNSARLQSIGILKSISSRVTSRQSGEAKSISCPVEIAPGSRIPPHRSAKYSILFPSRWPCLFIHGRTPQRLRLVCMYVIECCGCDFTASIMGLLIGPMQCLRLVYNMQTNDSINDCIQTLQAFSD